MKRLRIRLRAAWALYRHRYLSFVFRLAAGTVLIVSGSSKVAEGAGFVEEVADFDLLPEGLANVYATALPWVEIVVGALLILGLLSRISAGIGALTVLSFIIANSVVVYRGLNMECGCFGDMAVLDTRQAIIVDCVLFIMVLQILVHKGVFLSLGSRLLGREL
jgi:uncharacterized membrane protein YphA (DoxX/SURF4 family)